MIDNFVAAFLLDKTAGDQAAHRMDQQRELFVVILAQPVRSQLLLELLRGFCDRGTEIFIIVGQHEIELLIEAASLHTVGHDFGIADNAMHQQQNILRGAHFVGKIAFVPRHFAVSFILHPAQLIDVFPFQIGLEKVQLQCLADAAPAIRHLGNVTDADVCVAVLIFRRLAAEQSILAVKDHGQNILIFCERNLEFDFQRLGRQGFDTFTIHIGQFQNVLVAAPGAGGKVEHRHALLLERFVEIEILAHTALRPFGRSQAQIGFNGRMALDDDLATGQSIVFGAHLVELANNFNAKLFRKPLVLIFFSRLHHAGGFLAGPELADFQIILVQQKPVHLFRADNQLKIFERLIDRLRLVRQVKIMVVGFTP
ncbi:MAG: hypothetical protein ALAOOOJD_02932 [bacterium]|nr:hypothetical protein [bacterium]